jgi:hypothetical protein
MTHSIPTTATATEYGYIRWRSTLTGQEGGGNYPVANPAKAVALQNDLNPDLEHWFVPAAVHLPAANKANA